MSPPYTALLLYINSLNFRIQNMELGLRSCYSHGRAFRFAAKKKISCRAVDIRTLLHQKIAQTHTHTHTCGMRTCSGINCRDVRSSSQAGSIKAAPSVEAEYSVPFSKHSDTDYRLTADT